MSNVITIPGMAPGELTPERVLHNVPAALFEHVLVLGWLDNGKPYAASTTANKAENLLLVEAFKQALLSGAYD